jgi:uncharacterized glyoxalase superfamily protein PhnB
MSIHATLRYADADAAITFLTTVLGLTEGHVVRDDAGRVEHAELAHDGDVLMLGSRGPEPSPWDTGRTVTYLALEPGADVDAHHAAAVAAGAEVVQELTDRPYGSREYAVADAEGNIWSVGTYRP